MCLLLAYWVHLHRHYHCRVTILTNNVFVGYNISLATTSDDARKKQLMLRHAGEDLNDIFDTLSTEVVTPQPGTDETVFSKAVEALGVYSMSTTTRNKTKNFKGMCSVRHTNQEQFESV